MGLAATMCGAHMWSRLDLWDIVNHTDFVCKQNQHEESERLVFGVCLALIFFFVHPIGSCVRLPDSGAIANCSRQSLNNCIPQTVGWHGLFLGPRRVHGEGCTNVEYNFSFR